MRLERVRLFLVASYPVVRVGLAELLRTREEIAIVGEADSITDAVAQLRANTPDVVLIDPDGPDTNLWASAAAAEVCTNRVLLFTGATDPVTCVRAVELGASGVVSKSEPGDVVCRAIIKVHAGELWLDRAQTATVLAHVMRRGQDPEATKIDSLTRREREIVAKVGEGLKNVAIAERLFISEATVRNHLTSILSKLVLSDRFELAVYAFRHRLVEDVETGPPRPERPFPDYARPSLHRSTDRPRRRRPAPAPG